MTPITVPRPARSRSDDWIRLAAGHQRTAPEPADPPEPAARWLEHALPSNRPPRTSVELTMRGTIRLGRWRDFRAQEVLSPPDGFVWAASVRAMGLRITGFDRYSAGTGEMSWRAFGLVPVSTAHGTDVTRSAAGRLAAEGITFLPTAYRCYTWTEREEPDVAAATLSVAGTPESVRLRIGPGGELREVRMSRWGNPGGTAFGRQPFGVTVHGERTFGGITIASSFTAGWWRGTDRQAEGEFFRAEVVGAVFR